MSDPGRTVFAVLNTYFVLRHGRSLANERGLIVSSLANDGPSFGLSEAGRRQVAESVTTARTAHALSAVDLIVASPLQRTRESAEIVAQVLPAPIRLDDRLRERSFGDLELGSDTAYAQVWARDETDPSHTTWNVESLESVEARVRDLIGALESEGRGRNVILCTHGDVASVLACISLARDLRQHRVMGVMRTGDLRPL